MVAMSLNPLDRSDEEIVRSLADRYVAVWNGHDMTSLADLFTEDAEWINIVGMHWRGRAAIVKAHEVYHRTMFQNTGLVIESLEIRAIAADVAAAVVVVKAGGFVPPDGVPRPPTRDRLSLVAVRRGSGWRIVLGHNTVVDERAAPFDPANRGWTGEPPARV